MPLDDKQLNQIATLIERSQNIIAAIDLPLPPEVHLNGHHNFLVEVEKQLRQIYVDATGEDPWIDQPEP